MFENNHFYFCLVYNFLIIIILNWTNFRESNCKMSQKT